MKTKDLLLHALLVSVVFLSASAQPPPPCAQPPAGMVAWFPGDGNALDLQGGDSGTVCCAINSIVIFAPGKVAQAFQFDGSYDVRVAAAPAQDLSSAVTLDAWVAPLAGNNFSAIVFKGESFGSYALFLHADGRINFRLGGVIVDALDSVTQLPLNTYTHVAATYDGTTMSIYINGVLDASKSTTVGTLVTSNEPLMIGTFGYLGAIDELEIFNEALTPSEIQRIVAADSAGKCKPTTVPPPPPTSCVVAPFGMSAWYPGDNNAADIQGGNNGTLVGSVTFAPGKVSAAFQFDGTGRVEVPDAPALEATAALTLDAWVNPAAGNNFTAILFKGDGFGSYALFLQADGRINLRIGNPVSTPVVDAVDSITQIPLNAYTHIAATYDGTRMRLYINGALEVVKTTSIGSLEDGSGPLIIGLSDGAGAGYQGAIDELEIFNAAVLTQSEIERIFAAGSFGKCKSGGGCEPITLSPPTLPDGTVGSPYSQTITASGGTGPYVFMGEALPTGLTLNASTGEISGTPMEVGTAGFIITATDTANGCTGEQAYSIEVSPSDLLVTAAVSRKMHGTAGTFDISLPLSGEPGVECRSSGGNHTLVFTFTNDVVSGDASVTSGTGEAGDPIFSGKTMTVELSGVTNAQTITVTLSEVTDRFSQELPDTVVSANILLGDTIADKRVNRADFRRTKAQGGRPATEANFRADVDASGAIERLDGGIIKANFGTSIP